MLKHLKGARIMQDCNTGELFVDPGVGGQCKAMGGRPFYTETTELTVDVLRQADGPVLAELPNFPNFTAGDTVTVKVNGTEYALSAIYFGGVPVIGDAPEAFFNGAGTLGWLIANLGTVSAYSYEDCTVSYMAEIVHQVPPKFLPNSVWTEEENRVIADNVAAVKAPWATSWPTVFVEFPNFPLIESDIVTFVIDGVTYTYDNISQYKHDDDNVRAWLFPIGEYESIEYKTVEVSLDGSGLAVYPADAAAVSFTVTRMITKTNCDLAVEIEEHEDAGLSRIVRGSFDATVAKIERGLPVSVYAHGTVDWIQNGYTQAVFIAEITAVTAARRDGEYVLLFHAGGYDFSINRDGFMGMA